MSPVEGTPFGRYQLLDLLGRGGMGEVWRAHDTTIDRVVAIKMLLPHYAQDPAFEQRFRREARAAARLDEPHVVPIHDVGEVDGRLYVTMRLVDGVDLQTLLDAGPLDASRAVYVVEQIASALHSAHRAGLVHRDVKPSNILVADNDFAYLIDFGIARATDDTGLTSEGSTIGTWAYMAPERFGAGAIGPSCDIYALACVLYQCLTGELPFPGNTLEQVAVAHMVMPPPKPSEERTTVPTALDEVIANGLAKQPDDRYQTTVEMATAARQAITTPTMRPPPPPTAAPQRTQAYQPNRGLTPPPVAPPPHFPTSALPPPPPQYPGFAPHPTSAPPPRRGRGVLIGALAAVALLVVAGGIFATVTLTRPSRPAATTPSADAVNGSQFTGSYRADYGPGTDLQGNPVAGAPATTATWGVRSTCGSGGCVATASIVGGSGITLVSNATFDQLSGTWVAVALASAQCINGPTEFWVVYKLQPQPDGSLSGETTRASIDSGCSAKRTVKFTRTGDVDVNKVPDPAVLPPRSASAAEALHGSYRESTTFANGNVLPAADLTARTDCLRDVDRCMSLLHAPDGVITMIFEDGKWTRNEVGMTNCSAGGTAQITITAEFPLPEQLEDPIPVLTGRGTQTVAAGGGCTGGGDFVDTFERTGD